MREGPKRRWVSFAGSTSMATRLPAAVVAVSLISLITATIVGIRTGGDLGNQLTDDRLVSLRSSAQFDVGGRMRSLTRSAIALSSTRQAAVAIDRFAAGHEELLALPDAEAIEDLDAMVAAYEQAYIEPLADAGRRLEVREIVPDNNAALYIQDRYAVNIGELDEPAAVDDARDGSAWSETHAAVHPVYRGVTQQLGLFDLYLIEPERGYIVYSSQKHPDVGTSLDLGPFSGSVLASVYDDVTADPQAGVAVSDVSFYDPAVLTPVGALAAPVVDGERLVGVLAFLYDTSYFTRALTADGEWDEGGFPPTGETFLVAADGTMRSEPRSFLENPAAHVDAAELAGSLDEESARVVDAAGTTVLSQLVDDETLNAGLEGDTGVEQRLTSTGTEAFSTIAALDIAGLDYFVVAEVDESEASGDVKEFNEVLIVGVAIFVVLLTFAAVGWAAHIVRPIRAISERLTIGRSSGEPLQIPPRSPLEFRRLARSFAFMSEALHQQRQELAAAREERLALLRQMLPPSVADRVASGEVQAVEDVPQATVVVVVVGGLDVLVTSDDHDSGRGLIESLVADLDGLAERHGLERIKVVGDAYFAACGHARPFIDHAPRSVNFAVAARAAIGDVAAAADGVYPTIGVATGTVSVGSAGGVLYDVWGEAVTTAHYLARQARPGQILVPDAMTALLPDTITVERNDADMGAVANIVDDQLVTEA